jgi:peptide/nickel transport system substrate-binding protein
MNLSKSLASLLLTLGLCVSLRAESVLRFCIRSEPRTLHPLLVDDDASETIRYLTGGVLVRLNRKTQECEPALASSWRVAANGRQIDFVLRQRVRFSDGSPFGPPDVAYTIQQLMSPELHSPTADSFRTGPGDVRTEQTGPDSIRVTFPQPVAGLAALFDQVPMMSSRSPMKEKAVLGPYIIEDRKAGSFILLHRNPNYWERDASGHQLPHIDTIRLEIQQSRDSEALRMRRGDIDFVSNLDPDLFDHLVAEKKSDLTVNDLGASLDSELIWFNQTSTSHLPASKRAWFTDANFRRAVSIAIDRDEICRIVYRGHATPAAGPVSPSNHAWYNSHLDAQKSSIEVAKKLLASGGFREADGKLLDRSGNPVEFSLISNSGNRNHERMLAIIQQDLQKLGIHLNVVTLDFASLIERITRTYDYEACLMSLTNVGIDPNEQMNVWLSSAGNHQWNPNQKTPATPWEARIDQLMTQQAAASNPAVRKKLFDEVQMIVQEQHPFIYLVHPDVLAAYSKKVHNVNPALLRPQLYWNVDKQEITE